jgi:hypothetical protein
MPHDAYPNALPHPGDRSRHPGQPDPLLFQRAPHALLATAGGDRVGWGEGSPAKVLHTTPIFVAGAPHIGSCARCGGT